ncbi:MAG: acyl carrier protein [Geobacteraceae bacterium]|nr:acyl carrier protein [Geobacteraceae bacterium]
MTDSIRQFVVKSIQKKSKLPKGVDVDSFNYIDSGYVDSLGIIKFVAEIESTYDIEISDSEIESSEFRTVGGLVSIITRKSASGDKND